MTSTCEEIELCNWRQPECQFGEFGQIWWLLHCPGCGSTSPFKRYRTVYEVSYIQGVNANIDYIIDDKFNIEVPFEDERKDYYKCVECDIDITKYVLWCLSWLIDKAMAELKEKENAYMTKR